MKSIFLVGFMGAGKTHTARYLSSIFKLPFYDTDRTITEKAGKSIPQIFNDENEAFFRNLERETITGWNRSGIIATGGGCVQDSQIREFLKNDDHLTIWLNPGWAIIWQRISGSNRPLVMQKDEAELKALYLKREPFYREVADLVFKGNDLDELVEMIERVL